MLKKIYKYRALNQYAISEITGSYFVFSCPLDFNDPLDCQIRVDVKKAANAVNNLIEGLISDAFKDDPEFETELKEKLLTDPSENEELYYKKVVENLIGKLRVTCFSENYTNTLMWAHYASNHKGICAEFEYPDDQMSVFKYQSKVKYSDKYPVLILPEDMGDKNGEKVMAEIINKLVLTKQKIWAYEKEHRIVLDDNFGECIKDTRKNKIKFPPDALSAIYFGCNAEDNAISDLMDRCKERSRVPEFYRLRRQSGTFEYMAERIS